MRGKLRRLAAALLPVCFLCAQEPSPQAPQQPSPQATQQPDAQAPVPAHGVGFRQPSPEAMRQIGEQWQRMRAQANAINDLAGHIESPEDAKKLVDLVAAQFSNELPSKWAMRAIRDRVARAEYESAADPGTLIPEQRVADAWNDFLEKIGGPQEDYVTAAEIHTLRDSQYVSSQLSWAYGNQNVWTVPNIYALGADGKVANGCRALEALNILWQLANQPQSLEGARVLMAKNERLSDLYKSPAKPPAPGTASGVMTAQIVVIPPNPIEQAARQYMHEHGVHGLDGAIEGLLKELLAS